MGLPASEPTPGAPYNPGVGCLIIVLAFLVFLLGYRLWHMRPGPKTDPTLGDPDAKRLLKGLKRRQDWSAVHSFLAGQSDWQARAFYVNVLGSEISAGKDGPWLEAWRQQHPESSLPHLFHGVALIQWAWEARGSGTSDTVTDEGRRLFKERLAQAEAALQQAAQLDQADPTPFSWLITVTMGLQHPFETSADYYDEAVRRDPLHVATHEALLYRLTQKWGGSHEAMFRYARSVSAEAPAGHPLHMLVIDAHIMRYEYFWFEDDRDGRIAYFKQPEVGAEVRAIHDLMVESPDWVEPPHDTSANGFAFCFWVMDDVERLTRELRRMRERITDGPWNQLGYNAVELVRELRDDYAAWPPPR